MEVPNEAVDNIDSLWGKLREHGDVEVRNQIFEYYFPWCRKICSSLYLTYRHELVDWHDFVHVASLKLISLIEDFDANFGVPFEAYAYSGLKGAVINEIKVFSKDYEKKQVNLVPDYITERLPHVEEDADSFTTFVDAAIDLAFGMFLEVGILQSPGDRESPQYYYENEKTRAEIISLVEELGESERFVIKGHYFQHLRFHELAQVMDVSPGRVSQIHHAGLKKLREIYEAKKAY